MKKDFVTFKITLFFSNAMTDSIIFYTFNMDFVPNDVIITMNPSEKQEDKTNKEDSERLEPSEPPNGQHKKI